MKVFASSIGNTGVRTKRVLGSGVLGVSAALLTGFLISSAPAAGAQLALPLTGNLLGSVMDVAGIPQMGATVQVFNKYDRPISKTLTSADGRFAFAALPIDVYSVRVSLASFLPAARDQIAVKAGLDSILQIHLATLFSSIQVSYIVPDGAMSNDWKWVLRSSPATRPVTRYLPLDTVASASGEERPRVFSGTRAMLSLSGGDGGLVDSGSTSGDFGTGFVLSTNFFGKNQIQVGGTFGEAANLEPATMGLGVIYSRSDSSGFGPTPEVTFTMMQMSTAAPQVAGLQNSSAGLGAGPSVRGMSLSIYEVTDPLDNLHIEYGITGESVDYLQHTSRLSPFARITATLGKGGEVIAAYSDGGRPDELTAHQQYKAAEYESTNNELADTVNAFARAPELSQSNGRLRLQRNHNYEIGYRKTVGSRTYAASAFYEDVTNGRMNITGDLAGVDADDLFYDGVSTTSTYNIGNFSRQGYIASVDQRVNESLDFALAYGRMGGMLTSGSSWGSDGKFLDEKNLNVASANLEARIPRMGTRLAANYGWVDSGTLVPRHVFTTQNLYVQPGLNINFRQPLPSLFGLPGRVEFTADLRNLLAQGYLPLETGGGHRLLLVQSPRAIRGGLNFIF